MFVMRAKILFLQHQFDGGKRYAQAYHPSIELVVETGEQRRKDERFHWKAPENVSSQEDSIDIRSDLHSILL